MSSISKGLRDSTALYLAHNTQGFNAKFAAITGAYGIAAIALDWSATSKQFYQVALTPDDLDESVASKYPFCFLFSTGSENTHDSFPRPFSGQVDLDLVFWVSLPDRTIPRQMELILDAIEDVVNQMFSNGNWPQLWGSPNGILGNYSSTRDGLAMAGKAWRQSITFRLSFKLDQ